jgi:uncharacterized protein YdhG (YjbR/CyaY superfamily)
VDARIGQRQDLPGPRIRRGPDALKLRTLTSIDMTCSAITTPGTSQSPGIVTWRGKSPRGACSKRVLDGRITDSATSSLRQLFRFGAVAAGYPRLTSVVGVETEMNEGADGTAKKAAREATASRGPRKRKADGEAEVLANIAAMSGSDRALGERLHAIIKANAPALSPRLWYGMPAYAKDGKVLCFFQSAQKFKTRYATFGFQHEANLDEGHMWPVAFALTELTAAEEARIGALVKKAVS